MKKSIFLCNSLTNIQRVYSHGRRERIATMSDLYPHVITDDNFIKHAEALDEVEVAFSTWGMPVLKSDQLKALPRLKAVFYAASSVKKFAKPLLEKGIVLMSAWAANAIPVAEFTVAQIILANKGYFRDIISFKRPIGFKYWQGIAPKGNYDENVSILGVGMVGRQVIQRLTAMKLNVLVYDPYLSCEEAEQIGTRKVTLEQAFSEAMIISNHMPNLIETRGIINASLLGRLQDGATFINTGRGVTVVESDLISELQKRPTITALLDVTDPEEPPKESSLLYSMENIFLSSHIAGSLGNEVCRMADYCIDAYMAYDKGNPIKYAVSLDMLERLS